MWQYPNIDHLIYTKFQPLTYSNLMTIFRKLLSPYSAVTVNFKDEKKSYGLLSYKHFVNS